MYCPNNNLRCRADGFCNCPPDNLPEMATGCGGMLLMAVAGIFKCFIYPYKRITASDIRYNPNGTVNFVGATWLFVSPVFGFLSCLLFQLIFFLVAGATRFTSGRTAKNVFGLSMYSIYMLAIGLALIAFLSVNKEAIKDFAVEAESRTVRKLLILFGVGVMFLLLLFAIAGVASNVIEAYLESNAAKESLAKREQAIMNEEVSNYALYIGRYRFISSQSREIFEVKKTDDNKNLLLYLPNKNLKSGKATKCLMSSVVENDSTYYLVSNCLVTVKQRSLTKIYFDIKNKKTKMTFVYDSAEAATSESLEKIE